jgi:hypothetical protein
MMAYRREVLGLVSRRSTPDDTRKLPAEWWRRPIRPRRRGGWPGSRSRPFRPGTERNYPISLELGGRGMRGSGGCVKRNALIKLRHR